MRGGAGLGARLGHSPGGCHAPPPRIRCLGRLSEELPPAFRDGRAPRSEEGVAACLVPTLGPRVPTPSEKPGLRPEPGTRGGGREGRERSCSRGTPGVGASHAGIRRAHRAPPPAAAPHRARFGGAARWRPRPEAAGPLPGHQRAGAPELGRSCPPTAGGIGPAGPSRGQPSLEAGLGGKTGLATPQLDGEAPKARRLPGGWEVGPQPGIPPAPGLRPLRPHPVD